MRSYWPSHSGSARLDTPTHPSSGPDDSAEKQCGMSVLGAPQLAEVERNAAGALGGWTAALRGRSRNPPLRMKGARSKPGVDNCACAMHSTRWIWKCRVTMWPSRPQGTSWARPVDWNWRARLHHGMYIRKATALHCSPHARLKARERIQSMANEPSPLVLAPRTTGCRLGVPSVTCWPQCTLWGCRRCSAVSVI